MVCVLFGWLGALWIGSAWLEELLLEQASREAVATLRLVDGWVHAGGEALAPEPSTEEPLGASELGDVGAGVDSAAPAAPRRARTPDAIVVDKLRVLEWIRGQKVPRGRAVPASPWLPAGISIGSIGRFGLGLVPSDRLVRVDGREVREPSDVVNAVLSAFGRGAAQISGEFVRATDSGPRTIRLTVHFPTPEEVQAVVEGRE